MKVPGISRFGVFQGNARNVTRNCGECRENAKTKRKRGTEIMKCCMCAWRIFATKPMGPSTGNQHEMNVDEVGWMEVEDAMSVEENKTELLGLSKK